MVNFSLLALLRVKVVGHLDKLIRKCQLSHCYTFPLHVMSCDDRNNVITDDAGSCDDGQLQD